MLFNGLLRLFSSSCWFPERFGERTRCCEQVLALRLTLLTALPTPHVLQTVDEEPNVPKNAPMRHTSGQRRHVVACLSIELVQCTHRRTWNSLSYLRRGCREVSNEYRNEVSKVLRWPGGRVLVVPKRLPKSTCEHKATTYMTLSDLSRSILHSPVKTRLISIFHYVWICGVAKPA